MTALTDQQAIAAICERHNMSEEYRNTVLFNTGESFLEQFSKGKEMRKEKLFWNVFSRIFTAEDKGLLKHPEYGSIPYCELKQSMVLDREIKKVFCRMYHSFKGGDDKVERTPSELNLWRKRIISAIGAWLTMTGKQGGLALIKSVACRAAKKEDFNAIPKGQLVSLYNAFLQKQNDLKTVKTIE